MSGVIAALATGLVALFMTQLFYPLPEATLGAIVIVAVSHMVKVRQMRHLYRVLRTDFFLAVAALVALLTIEILQSLLLAVIVSLFALVLHASRAKLAVLGRAPDRVEFSDARRHPENRTVPGLLMVRPENELFFANAAGIKEAVVREVNASAAPVKVVLVDMSATSDLDAPSADTLVSLRRELGQRDVHLVLAHVITPVREVLERADATKEIGADDIYPSVVEAVRDYLVTEPGDPGRRELVHMGLLELRDTIRARTSAVSPELEATLAAILRIIDEEVEAVEGERS